MRDNVQGLKATSKHRKNPLRTHLPVDLDGAFRVDSRLDRKPPAKVWAIAEERQGK